jgi:hypothetical protein
MVNMGPGQSHVPGEVVNQISAMHDSLYTAHYASGTRESCHKDIWTGRFDVDDAALDVTRGRVTREGWAAWNAPPS